MSNSLNNVTVGFRRKITKVFTTQEDWIFNFRFFDKSGAPLSQTGATFKITFVPISPTTVVPAEITLTPGAGADSHIVTGKVAKATSAAYGVGQWAADLVRTKDSNIRRYVPVVVRQASPGDII